MVSEAMSRYLSAERASSSVGLQYMSWITVIDENEAEGELKHVYEEIIGARGKMSNIMRAQSLNPASMRAHIELYVTLMFRRSSLRRPDCELLAAIVSSVNGCQYCIKHHAEALHFYWKNRDRVDRLIRDYRTAELNEEQLAMAGYAIKLTSAPTIVSETDIQDLRGAGFSDRQILDINLIVSYFNFVNRIADGLGVEVGEEDVSGFNY